MSKNINLTLLKVLILGLIMCFFVSITVSADEKKVVYVSGTHGDDSNSGETSEELVKTFDKAISLLEGEGGTVVVIDEVIVDGTYYLPVQSDKLTITSLYDGDDYSGKFTLGLQKKGIFQAQSEIEFNNIVINNGTGPCAELWTGPSLIIGEKVTASVQDGPMGKDLANGDIAFRCGNYNKYSESASLEINSGTWSYIQGGNNKFGVGTTTIDVGGSSEILMYIQCGGTNNNVDSSTLNTNGVDIPIIYVNGYGSASINTCKIVVDGGDISKIYGVRTEINPTGNINDAVDIIMKKESMKNILIDLENVEGHVKPECNTNFQIKDSEPESIVNINFSDWDKVTIDGNSEIYLISNYSKPSSSMTVGESSRLILTKDDSIDGITWEGMGSIEVGGLPPSYDKGNGWNFVEANKMLRRGAQGIGIFGDKMYVLSAFGSCIVYDLNTFEEIGSFNLGSYNDGTDDGKDYNNHANQAMFSGTFYDGNTIPLFYVTDGNSGGIYPEDWKDERLVGSYIGHCSVENIVMDEHGGYQSELVQSSSER